jgi:uncharacterized protein (TIGR03000 family)
MRPLFLLGVFGLAGMGLILTPIPANAQIGFRVAATRTVPFAWEAQWWQNPSWRWQMHGPSSAGMYPQTAYSSAPVYQMPYVTNMYYPPNFSSQSSLRTGTPNSGYGSYPPPESARTGSSQKQAELPHPAGNVKVAPADAGVIRMQVPDELATVSFNGRSVSSIGKERDFVTPDLGPGEKLHYDIAVNWGRGGQRTTVERAVDVGPGQIVALDFPQMPPVRIR